MCKAQSERARQLVFVMRALVLVMPALVLVMRALVQALQLVLEMPALVIGRGSPQPFQDLAGKLWPHRRQTLQHAVKPSHTALSVRC